MRLLTEHVVIEAGIIVNVVLTLESICSPDESIKYIRTLRLPLYTAPLVKNPTIRLVAVKAVVEILPIVIVLAPELAVQLIPV